MTIYHNIRHKLHAQSVSYCMDYSRFYLKNYVPEKTDDKEDDDKIVFPKIELRNQPEIIYINPDGEEFEPDFTDRRDNLYEENRSNLLLSQEDTDNRENHTVPTSFKKPNDKKQSTLNRICQAILIFAIVVMSIIVSADFVSNGKAISAITSLLSDSTPVHYAVLTNPKDDLETSQVDSYAMRLKGGAGYIVKNQGKFYNVYAVYDNEEDANDYIKLNGGEIVKLTTENYDAIKGELKNYTDYPMKLCGDLNATLKDLTDKKITTSEALEKLNDIKNNFDVTYDNMSNVAKSDEESDGVILIANASVAVAALERLCDTTVSRPNLACDIRYTVCQILFTYYYSS